MDNFIVHFIFTVFSGIIVTGNLRTALRWGIVLMLWGVLFISPWILLHASNYVSILGGKGLDNYADISKEAIELSLKKYSKSKMLLAFE